jgi:Ca2+-binding EF-hand superfamily protein
MFLLVDKDGNGFVGFEEFLDLFQILSSGMVKKETI